MGCTTSRSLEQATHASSATPKPTWINLKWLFQRSRAPISFALSSPTIDRVFGRFHIDLQTDNQPRYYLTPKNSNVQRTSLLEMIHVSKSRATLRGMLDGRRLVITLICTRHDTIMVQLRLQDYQPIHLIVWEDEVHRLQESMATTPETIVRNDSIEVSYDPILQ